MFTPSTLLPVCTYSTFHCPKHRDVRNGSSSAVLVLPRAVKNKKQKQRNSLVVEAALHLGETRATRTVRVVIGSVQWWRAGQQGVCFVEVGSVPCAGCLMER